MSKLETVAIAGVGRAGLQHARAASAIGLRVAAFSSLSESSQRAQAFSQEFPLARRIDFSDGSLSESADLLVLALPPEVTDEALPRFVHRGRQLLVEKPLALSTPRIEEIAALALDTDCRVTVGYNRRVYPLVLRLREFLQDNPPKTAEVTIVEDLDFIAITKGPRSLRSYLRHGATTHMLDLAEYLFGELTVEDVRAAQSPHGRGFVDYEIASRGERGTRVNITIDAGDRSRRGMRLVTADGQELRLAPLEHLWIGPQRGHTESDGDFNGMHLDNPTSYTDSFVTQMRLIREGRISELHGVHDSLKLSKFVDLLEVASEGLRHE
jgi:predicted dehydrogenase